MLIKAKLLILDDDDAVRASLVKVLEMEGFEVLQASNGLDAIDFFRTCRVDLVVLDVNLEEENGWSVFEAMKELNPFVPTVVITAEFDQREIAMGAGAEALIEKPMEVSVLLGIVRDLLAESSEQRLERVCGNDEYCRYVAGYHAPFLTQLDQRHIAPLELSPSRNAVFATKFTAAGEQETFPNRKNAPRKPVAKLQ